MRRNKIINHIEALSIGKQAFILFFVALLFRLTLSFTYGVDKVYTDAVMYHNYAVNIAKGNGYTADTKEPFRVNYFREPGNTYFIAGAYKVAELFGCQLNYIDPDTDKAGEGLVSVSRPEIYWARIFYSILESLSVVFLFLTLLYFFTRKHAFIISLIFCAFYPAFFFVVSLMRESLLTSVMIILNYFFVNYLYSKKKYLLLIIGLLLGILVLLFQLMSLLGLIMLVILFLHDKKVWETIRSGVLIGGIAILVISPWLYKAYSFYPDIRVLKTFGVSLTMEMTGCMEKAREIEYCKGMTTQELNQYLTGLYELPSDEQFKKSIDGTFKYQSDSLNHVLHKLPAYNAINISKYKLLKYMKSAGYFLCPNYFSGLISFNDIKQSPLWLKLILIIPFIFLFSVCILGIAGVIVYYKQINKYLLVFFFFSVVLIIMPGFGSEGRRFLPMFTVWVPAAYMLVYNQRQKWIRKLKG